MIVAKLAIPLIYPKCHPMTAFSLFTGNVQLLGWVGGKKDSYKVNGKVLCGTPFVYTYCKLNGSV